MIVSTISRALALLLTKTNTRAFALIRISFSAERKRHRSVFRQENPAFCDSDRQPVFVQRSGLKFFLQNLYVETGRAHSLNERCDRYRLIRKVGVVAKIRIRRPASLGLIRIG